MTSRNGPDPIFLTDEEIEELNALFKHHSTYGGFGNPIISGYEYDMDFNDGWDGDDDLPPKILTKHEWVPTLLITSTVYTCKLCGCKKEKATEVYCEKEFEF